jgi:hypothetical protein
MIHLFILIRATEARHKSPNHIATLPCPPGGSAFFVPSGSDIGEASSVDRAHDTKSFTLNATICVFYFPFFYPTNFSFPHVLVFATIAK